MHLKKFSNQELHSRTIALVREETRLTLEILHHLREIEARKLYAERGHSSLFEYATRELRYSESAAQRRIASMRALRELPELEKKIETGDLKLTQVAQVQSFFRAEKKSGKFYSVSKKREVFQAAIGLSTRATERMLAEKNPLSLPGERVRAVTQEISQVSLTIENELLQKLERIRNRFAHQLPVGASLSDVVAFMANRVLENLPEEKPQKQAKSGNRMEVNTRVDPSVAAPAVKEAAKPVAESMVASVEKSPVKHPIKSAVKIKTRSTSPSKIPSRYIPMDVKKSIWKRDQSRCVYRSSITGKICGSPHRLEIDHIRPFARGGRSDQVTNLRLLCATHNQVERKRVFREIE